MRSLDRLNKSVNWWDDNIESLRIPVGSSHKCIEAVFGLCCVWHGVVLVVGKGGREKGGSGFHDLMETSQSSMVLSM